MPSAFVIASDGDWDDEWREGASGEGYDLSARGLYHRLFGEEITTPPFRS